MSVMSRGIAARRGSTCFARVIALAVTITVLASCTAGKNRSTPPEPALGAIGRITQDAQVVSPIDSYLISAADFSSLVKIQVAATDDCLHAAGVPAGSVLPADLEEFAAGQARDRIVRSSLFGFFDTENYRHYGYQRPPGTPISLAIKSPDVSSLERCNAKGHAAIGNLELTAESSVLPGGGPVLPLADSRYQGAVTDWRKCMAGRGFHYSDSRAPLSDPQWRNRPSSASVPAVEIATATADVQCKVSTNLVGIAVAVQAAYDQLYLRTHAGQLAAFRDQVQGYLRNATK